MVTSGTVSGLTERDKPRQGVVAATLDLFRNGAVGFIDLLDGLSLPYRSPQGRNRESSLRGFRLENEIDFPSLAEHLLLSVGCKFP